MFKYDPFGRRIQKSGPSGTTNYVYDGANGIEEVNGAAAVTARYVQGAGIDEPLAESGAVLSYYSADGLGSITSLTDATGTTAATFVYGAFGVLNSSTGTIANPYRYTGREFDQETGLYYYRARYYDAQFARFLSEDPISFYAGRNFYQYVGNSAPNYVDPSGKYLTPATNSTPGDIRELGRALAYLLQDSEMAQIIYQLATDPDLEIVIDMHIPLEWGNQTVNNIIYWDPHRASACKNGGYQTPAMQLGHELAHNLNPVTKKRDKQYGNTEEKRVIEGPERHACKTLHECIRYDHDDTPSPYVPTSTSLPQSGRL
jgi:RHS repeat-associated protein